MLPGLDLPFAARACNPPQLDAHGDCALYLLAFLAVFAQGTVALTSHPATTQPEHVYMPMPAGLVHFFCLSITMHKG